VVLKGKKGKAWVGKGLFLKDQRLSIKDFEKSGPKKAG